MRSAATDRLTRGASSWPFLVSLFLLFLNDLCLKTYYPGVLTGKLSDFSGIFLVSVLLFTIFDRSVYEVVATVYTLFTAWKSPASEPLIEFVRGLGVGSFGRVVDYTDLLALGMVLPARCAVRDANRYHFPIRRLKRIIALPIGTAALFAILGTSVVTLRNSYHIRAADSGSKFGFEAAAEAIKTVAEKSGLKCSRCKNLNEQGRYEGNGLTLSYKTEEPRIISFSISAVTTSVFFGRTAQEKMDALRNDLKSEFGARFQDLELVESLREKR